MLWSMYPINVMYERVSVYHETLIIKFLLHDLAHGYLNRI